MIMVVTIVMTVTMTWCHNVLLMMARFHWIALPDLDHIYDGNQYLRNKIKLIIRTNLSSLNESTKQTFMNSLWLTQVGIYVLQVDEDSLAENLGLQVPLFFFSSPSLICFNLFPFLPFCPLWFVLLFFFTTFTNFPFRPLLPSITDFLNLSLSIFIFRNLISLFPPHLQNSKS